MNKILRPAAFFAAASLVTGVLTVSAAGVAGASQQESNAVGTLVFYNAAGQQITSGNVTDAPLAAYVEGSATIRSGDTKATLFGYLPVAGEDPGQWSGEQLSASTTYPDVSAPSPLSSATLPVVTGSALDNTIANLAAAFPNTDTSSDGYTGLYELRLRTSGGFRTTTTQYDEAYIEISGSTWSVVSPSLVPDATTTTLTASPASPQSYGTAVQLTATVSPIVPGTVQFENGTTPIGSPATVNRKGIATVTTSALPVGTDSLNAVFTPNDYEGSGGGLSFTVNPLTLHSTPPPTISGTVAVGQSLTAVPGTWDNGVSLAYQWLDDGTPIVGATSSSYVPQVSDFGQTLTVAVTGSLANYTSVTETSLGSTVGAGTLLHTPVPTISGSDAVGQTLTATPGTWDSGATLGYQWFNDGNPITGATSPTYTLQAADQAQSITVAVTGTLTAYNTVTETSLPVVVGAGTLVNTPTPTVTGTSAVGQTLTAVPGTWDSGVSLAYQWLSGGTPIVGATSSTFTLTAAQLGTSVSVTVTGSLAGYNSVSETSSGSLITAGTIASTPKPTISGTPTIGSVLTAVPGTWSNGVTLNYQWLLNGVPIIGATSNTYKLITLDLEKSVSVDVTGSELGFTPVSETSTGVTALNAIPVTPVPTVTGKDTVGSVLKVVPGTWSNKVVLSYQWLKNGAPISGATTKSLTLTTAEFNTNVTVAVTGTEPEYLTVTKTSVPVAIAAGTIAKAPKPTISGTAKVGLTVTAVPGKWSTGVTLGYQWLINNAPVSGATSTTLTLTAGDLGKSVQVVVTGTEFGYTTVAKTSAAKVVGAAPKA